MEKKRDEKFGAKRVKMCLESFNRQKDIRLDKIG